MYTVKRHSFEELIGLNTLYQNNKCISRFFTIFQKENFKYIQISPFHIKFKWMEGSKYKYCYFNLY